MCSLRSHLCLQVCTLKGHCTNFTHKVHFNHHEEYYSAFEYRSVMSCESLDRVFRSLKKITLMVK